MSEIWLALNKLHEMKKIATPAHKRKLILDSLFNQQKAFVISKKKRRLAWCTRRAGKTEAIAALLFLEAMRVPGSCALYLGLTRVAAKKILWAKLKRINSDFKLGMKFVESELTIRLENGSRIMLYGADQEGLADRLLGDAYVIVCVDEAQSFGMHLQYLIDDVLEPATIDYDGSIVLCGTPGPVPVGYFFDACMGTKKGWEIFRWTLFENPYLKKVTQLLKDLATRNQWKRDNPTFRRQYLGEWVQDLDALVYKFQELVNTFKELPANITSWNYIMGVDYGWNDSTAFCIVAWSERCQNAYLVEAIAKQHMGVTEIAEMIKALMSKYPIQRIVCDTGGLGKTITEEMKKRHGLFLEPAEKIEKVAAISCMNDDYANKRFFVHESLKGLIGQYAQLTWDTKSHYKKVEDPALPNDYCDGCLYAHRISRHYWYKEEAKKPVPGSESWHKQMENDMFDEVVEQYHQEQNQDDLL